MAAAGLAEVTDDLFPDEAPPAPAPPRGRVRTKAVSAAPPSAAIGELAAAMPATVHLGTSSWAFPGWKGLVWDSDHSEATLSRHGLAAYAQHPLLRTVSLDRVFYRPLSASQYAAHAAQVPGHFRFVVKAPSMVTDALVRGEDGRALQPNPAFLSPDLALSAFVQPALEGLGPKAGALVFQISPLPAARLARLPELLQRLESMLAALPRTAGVAVAVEVRNPELLIPAFASALKRAGTTYCLGLHAKMPPIEAQLPMLRALWPGPLVGRWNLHRKHGAQGYEEAKLSYAPFDALVDPDPETRDVLARVIVATAAAGFHSFVTINNKAEGSAPLSVVELARTVSLLCGDDSKSRYGKQKR